MIKDRVIKAYNFAEKAHEGQVRKFSGLPYFSHPKGVARVIEDLTGREELIIVSFLHDTLEDTNTTYDDIEKEFGIEIADLVLELTSDNEIQNKHGKKYYLSSKIVDMSTAARIVKLADRYHNILYLQGDSVSGSFIEKYYKETRFILMGLEQSGLIFSSVENILIEKIKTILDFLAIRHKL